MSRVRSHPDTEDHVGCERLEELFRRHEPAVVAYVRRRAPEAVVDDIVAETFLVAWRRLDEVPELALPWLFAVARRVLSTYRRGDRRRRDLGSRLAATQPSLAVPAWADDGDGCAIAALTALPGKDREALMLIAWEGLTPTQAALVLDEPAVRFRVRLHRAKRRIRTLLEQPSSASPPHYPPFLRYTKEQVNMTKTMSDEDLYQILRAADPLSAGPARPTATTEAALSRLLARGPVSGEPPRRENRRRRAGTSWWVVRVAPLAGAAAIVVAVISALPAGGPVSVPAASAKVILAKAAAAVVGSDGAILHADISATQTWQNGHSETWTEQDWQQASSPYDARTIDIGIWPTTVEMAYVKGQMWLYDQTTNIIYTNAPPPAFTLTAGPQPNTYTLHAGSGTSQPSLTVTASQAAALHNGTDIWAGTGQGGIEVIPRPTTGPQELSSFRSKALSLLHAPGAKVTRNLTVDGQDALQVTSSDGMITYDLNPTSYAPIQMTNTIGPGTNFGDPGNDGTVTLTFTDWQDLTGAAAPGLLSLTAQHPTAAIDNSATDYYTAESRLFP